MNNNYSAFKIAKFFLPIAVCLFSFNSWSQSRINAETQVVEGTNGNKNITLENLDLFESARVQEKGVPFTLHLDLPNNEELNLNLERYDLYASDVVAINQYGEELDLKPSIALKGSLSNDPNSRVRVTISESNFHLKVYNKEALTIEKIKDASQSGKNVYKITRGEEHNKKRSNLPGCGGKHADNTQTINVESATSRKLPTSRSNKKVTYCLTFATVVDVQAQQKAGDKNTFKTDFDIVLNVINGYYETFDLKFNALPFLYIDGSSNPWTDAPDSYTQNHTNFSKWADVNLTDKVGAHNVGALVTGHDFSGINYAWLDQMCPGESGHTQLTYNFFKNQNDMAWFGNISTHEVGHIWSCEHITQDNKKIMSPSIYAGNLQWSPTSTSTMNSSVPRYDGRGCLGKCDIIDGVKVEAENNSIEIFPLPANDILNIQLGDKNTGTYEIHSIDGKLVQKGNLNSSFSSINIAALPKGGYFINIKTKTPSLQQKVDFLIIR